MEINRINVIPEPLIQKNKPGSPKKAVKKTAESFQDIFSRELAGAKQIKVSAHAQRRMLERNITLNRADWEKINHAVSRAESKGAKNSLLIHGELALIVSVKNRTVISAMDEESIKEHVFTNIDSAVIIK
jgi:flagellar operon protein